MRFQRCGFDPTYRRALELHRFHARHARRPGEIVTRIGSVESVASVFLRGRRASPTESEVRAVCRWSVWVGSTARRGARAGLGLDPWPNRSIPLPAASIPLRLSSRGRPGAAAGCSSGLTEERGALRGRERDRADRGGTEEGTWGRTRSCSRPSRPRTC